MPKQPRLIKGKPGAVQVQLEPYEVVATWKLDYDSTNLDRVTVERRRADGTITVVDCIAGRGEYRVGDKVAYIPAGLVLMLDPNAKAHSHLSKDYKAIVSYFHRVRERRFRGVKSPGILVPWYVNQHGHAGPDCWRAEDIEVIVDQPKKKPYLEIPAGYELTAPYYKEIGRRLRSTRGGPLLVEHNGRWITAERLENGKAKAEQARAKKAPEVATRRLSDYMDNTPIEYWQFRTKNGDTHIHVFMRDGKMAVALGAISDGPVALANHMHETRPLRRFAYVPHKDHFVK